MNPTDIKQGRSDGALVSAMDWRHVLLAVTLMALSLVPIWIAKYFPSQNGPWYMLAAFMMGEMGTPEFRFAEFYKISPHPIPHMLHTTLVFGVSHIAPILVAQKVALSLYVVLVPIAIYYFLSVAAPDKKVLAYFAFGMIHNFTFYRGYHNFCLSIPMFFFSFGFWLKHRDTEARWPIFVSAILVCLLYLAHLFGFLLFVCAVGWYRLIESRSLSKACLSVAKFSWAGWVLLADFVVLNLTTTNWVDKSEREWLSPHTSLEYFWRKFFFGISTPAYLLGVLLSIWVLWLVGRRFVQGWQDEKGTRWGFLRDPFLSMVFVLVVSFFLVPWKFWNWHYISARLIPFILGISLACVGKLPEKVFGFRFRQLFLVSIVVGVLGINLSLAKEVCRIERDLLDYTSGIEFFDVGATLLPIYLDNPPVGQVRPLTRAHEYYHMSKGGANRKGAAQFNTLVPVQYREYPIDFLLPEFDPNDSTTFESIKHRYDFILLLGSESETEYVVQQLGFERIHERGPLQMYKNMRLAGEEEAN